ncbi:Extended synaptotagminlike protein 2a, partial [Caligus rogercresseyi]
LQRPFALIMSLFIHSCTNLAMYGNQDIPVNSYVEIQESNGPFPIKTQVIEDDQHPSFEYGKILQFSQDWKEHFIDLFVKDISGHLFGTLRLTLKDLQRNPIHKRIKPLDKRYPA